MQATITIDDKIEADIQSGKFAPKGDIIKAIKRREAAGLEGHAVCLALIAGMPHRAIDICENIGYFAKAYEIAEQYNLPKERKRLARRIRKDVDYLIDSYSTPVN